MIKFSDMLENKKDRSMPSFHRTCSARITLSTAPVVRLELHHPLRVRVDPPPPAPAGMVIDSSSG